MIKTSQEFGNVMRHMHWLTPEMFKEIFGVGADQGEHLWNKFYHELNRDIAKFICNLDNTNLDALFKYLDSYLEKNRR